VKYIIISILILFSLSAYGQIEDTPLFVGKYFGNQSGGGSGYWQVTGNFTDETGYYDATSIQVGDVLFFVDAGIGYHLPVTSIISASGSSFTVRVNNDGITGVSAVPNGAGGFYRANSPKGLWPDPAGLTAPDRQTLNSFLIKRINQEPVKRDTFITVPHSTNFIPSLVVTNASRFYNNVYISAKGGTDTSTVAFLAAPNTSHYGVVYNIKADSGLVETRILSDAHLSNTKSSYLLRRGQMAQVRALPDQVQANAYKWAVNVSWDSTVVSGGGGVSDGDKGDITVSSSGATWTIDNGVVTSAKVASQTLDSTDLKNRGTTLLKLAQSGATNGQVPKFNSTIGNWVISSENIEPFDSIQNIDIAVSLRSDQSSCVKLNGDTLLLMYAEYPGNPADNNPSRIVRKYSYDNGITWTSREIVWTSSSTGLSGTTAVYLPSLITSGDTIHSIFVARQSPTESGIYYSKSVNKGVGWTTPVELTADNYIQGPASDRLFKTSTGRLLYASSILNGSNPVSDPYLPVFFYSDNGGNTWTRTQPTISGVSTYMVETGVYQIESGNIVCYGRTTSGIITAMESSDNGITWGTVYRYPILAAMSQSTIKYDETTKSVIAFYNPVIFDQNDGRITTRASERATLDMAISYDGGQSFSKTNTVQSFKVSQGRQNIEPNFLINNGRLILFYSISTPDGLKYSLVSKFFERQTYNKSGNMNIFNKFFGEKLQLGTRGSTTLSPRTFLDIQMNNDLVGGFVNNRTRGINLGMDSCFFSIGDADQTSLMHNRFYVWNALNASTQPNEFISMHNKTTSTFPAFKFTAAKNNFIGLLANTDLAFDFTNNGTSLLKLFGNGDATFSGAVTETVARKTFRVAPTSTSERIEVIGDNISAIGGYYRIGLGTGSATNFYPFTESQPIGNWPTEFRFRQTSSSTSTQPLVFNFVTSAGGSLAANTVMQRWNSNSTTRMTVDQEGDLSANSFIGLLRPTVGAATAGTAPLQFILSGSVLLTAPSAGAVEVNSLGKLFYTPASTRYEVFNGLSGSATLDFGSTAAGASTDLTITVTGAADGDVVSLGVPNASVTATGRYFAWVSATNTVTVRFSPTILVGSEDPGSGVFKVTVTK